MTELKPCPFCGGTSIKEAWQLKLDVEFFATCASCGASGPVVTLITVERETDGERRAIELWNARHTAYERATDIARRLASAIRRD